MVDHIGRTDAEPLGKTKLRLNTACYDLAAKHTPEIFSRLKSGVGNSRPVKTQDDLRYLAPVRDSETPSA